MDVLHDRDSLILILGQKPKAAGNKVRAFQHSRMPNLASNSNRLFTELRDSQETLLAHGQRTFRSNLQASQANVYDDATDRIRERIAFEQGEIDEFIANVPPLVVA